MIEYNTWFDIKLTSGELKRLTSEMRDGNLHWFIDGKYAAVAKPNAERLLRQKIFDEYVRTGKRKGK